MGYAAEDNFQVSLVSIFQHPCLQVSITKHKGSPSPRKQSPPATAAASHGHRGGGHGGHKSGVNIMADLAVQTNKRNLLVGTARPRQKSQNGMEVIVYPSGQLLKGTNPEIPPKSTIGPRLEAALRNSFYRNQGRIHTYNHCCGHF